MTEVGHEKQGFVVPAIGARMGINVHDGIGWRFLHKTVSVCIRPYPACISVIQGSGYFKGGNRSWQTGYMQVRGEGGRSQTQEIAFAGGVVE